MPVGLYIHVPFCIRKCTYCDFVSYPYRDTAAAAYLQGLGREMEMHAAGWPASKQKIDTVYIGGGTPTCLPLAGLKKIVDGCFKYFDINARAEVSIEANPGTLDSKVAAGLLAAGVNRLSLGIQSCHEHELSLLGRIHTYSGAKEAFKAARAAGFENISVDLIYGLPGQTAGDWRQCLDAVAALEPDHISAYGLQLEAGTPLHASVGQGIIPACDEEEELKMLWETISSLAEHGFEHYEISNFARPGKQCAHNLTYWHNHQYLGLGPAACSYRDGFRYGNKTTLKAYTEDLNAGRFPVAEKEQITADLEMTETVFLGLRLLKGLDLDNFYRRFGLWLSDVYAPDLEALLAAGLVEIKNNHLSLTARGLPVANQVFMAFLP